MDKDKLIWAGFGFFTMVSFVCLQLPFSQSAKKSSSARRPRGDNTNSKQRHSTLSHLSASEKENRSRGSLASQRPVGDLCVGDKNSTLTTSQQNTSPAKRQQINGSSSATARAIARSSHRHTRGDGLTLSKNTAKNYGNTRSSQTNIAFSTVGNDRRFVERSTQTKSRAAEELCCGEDIFSISNAGDALECISPISKKEKYIASPLSSAGVYFSPPAREKGEKDAHVPLYLERGIDAELAKLVSAVNSSETDPIVWVDLYNFLMDIPWRVLQHIIHKKTVTLSCSLSLVETDTLADDEFSNFLRLKNEVYRLLQGHPPQKKNSGQFEVVEDGSKVLWFGQTNDRQQKKGRFSHIYLSSSDDDDDNNSNKERNEGGVKMAERIEKVLFSRRRTRMRSFSAQFPEKSCLEVEGRAEKAFQATTPLLFENEEVLLLLRNLTKLRHNTAFSLLQSSGVDISFLASIIDVTNEAQRLLDRAALRTLVASQLDFQQSPCLLEPSVVFAALQTSPPRLQPSSENLLLTPQATREETLEKISSSLLWPAPISVRQGCEDSSHGDSLSTYVAAHDDIVDTAERGDSNDKNTNNIDERTAATPPRNNTSEVFSRLLTTSTIPSTSVLRRGGQECTVFERSRTQGEVAAGQNSEFTSLAAAAFEGRTQPGRSVFDRLYTPPKVTQKVSFQQSLPSTAKAKTRFNVYV